jgi:hypothetical protein
MFTGTCDANLAKNSSARCPPDEGMVVRELAKAELLEAGPESDN